jgi:hypothetical protein
MSGTEYQSTVYQGAASAVPPHVDDDSPLQETSKLMESTWRPCVLRRLTFRCIRIRH